MDNKVFIGEWRLSGVAKGFIDVEGYDETFSCEYMDVYMNGNIIRCTEDPQDGYRSTLGKVEQIDVSANMSRFPSIEVVGEHVTEDDMDSVIIYDKCSRKVVMEIGTNYHDNYYPYCILHYMPEHMTPCAQSEREYREQCRREIPKSFVRRPITIH